MSASATSTGDDLIIISDEKTEQVEISKTSEPISWELQITEEQPTENTINFELTSSIEAPVTQSTPLVDAGFNLSNTEMISNAIEVSQEQEVVSEKVETTPMGSSTSDNTVNDENMDDILQEAIGKLKLRQENISRIKEAKNADIEVHNGKIKMLQDKVTTLKSEVDWLDIENSKIQANIVSLESMKAPLTDDGGGVSIDVKAYNQKRAVKTAKV